MTSTLIDTTGLTKFGDMTSGGGLDAIFDSNTGSTGYSQTTNGYAGVYFPTPLAIDRAEFISANNGFDASGSNTGITLRLYGKQGSAPTSSTDGTLLGTLSFFDTNTITTKSINSNDEITEWNYVWGVLNTGVWCVLSELKLYKFTPPQQQSSNVFSLIKSCNISVPLAWSTTEIPDFRQGVFVEVEAVATVHFLMNVVHNNLNGYVGALGISSHLLIRSGNTWADTQAASFSYIPNVLNGSNISSLTDHYGNLMLIAKIPLLANKYYEFSVTGSAHTTASSNNGQASILVENGQGLNYFMIQIDKNERLVS